MPVATQPTEKPGLYQENFERMKEQMMGDSSLTRRYSEEEIGLKIKYALIQKAKDKVEYLIRGNIRKGLHKRNDPSRGLEPMSEAEFRSMREKQIWSRLQKDGFPMSLTKDEQEKFDVMNKRDEEKAAEETAQILSQSLKAALAHIQ